jgi:4-methyl-5(b-hydroxyethyl)-thiazole monophosphate biosynthesis
MNKSVLIPLAEGFEELEAVTLIDLLRRAQIDVVVAGLAGRYPIKASRGVVLVPDVALDDVLEHQFDMLVLPGGLPGAYHLRDDERVIALLQRHAAEDKLVGAICAAPLVLAQAGLLLNKQVTAYPGVLSSTEYHLRESAVVQDGFVMTSRGPGTAMDFALAIIGQLMGESMKKQVESGLVR